MSVRARALAGLAGLVVFVALGTNFEPHFWSAWWFYVGVGLTLSAVFLEPFYGRPQDAIVNSGAALGALWTASRDGVPVLWAVFGALVGLVLLAGILAAVLPERSQRLKTVAYRTATSLGRAVLLGGAVLVLAGIDALEARGQHLILAAFALTSFLVIPWTELLRLAGVKQKDGSATAVAAFGPRMLLVDAAGTEFAVGSRAEVASSRTSAQGTIISRMPHAHGMRYQVALDVDWNELCRRFPSQLALHSSDEEREVVGTIGEGTTDTFIEFEPVKPVRVGAPVLVREGHNTVLYQVASLQLRRIGWEGASALIPHAGAMHVGVPGSGVVTYEPALPTAHELVEPAAGLSMPLPEGYSRLGVVIGTGIEVGVDLREAHQGHLAILGMSGMGKTSVAKRICEVLGQSGWVLALDTTGEYRTRLGFAVWEATYGGPGYWVYEPTGDPPTKAREVIYGTMEAANQEYSEGRKPQRRVVLLEEAHGFVPEWNFAARHQQEQVNLSARMVMQARKFEVSFVAVSQRTAVLSKSVLSQCENYIILKTVDQTSLSYLEGIFGDAIRRAVPSLQRYQGICAGPAFNTEAPVIVSLDSPG